MTDNILSGHSQILDFSYNFQNIYVNNSYPQWRMKWQCPPVFLPGEFRGQRSLAGHSPWGPKESDMTEQLTQHTLQPKKVDSASPVI